MATSPRRGHRPPPHFPTRKTAGRASHLHPRVGKSMAEAGEGCGGERREPRVPQDRSQEVPWRRPRRGWVRSFSPPQLPTATHKSGGGGRGQQPAPPAPPRVL